MTLRKPTRATVGPRTTTGTPRHPSPPSETIYGIDPTPDASIIIRADVTRAVQAFENAAASVAALGRAFTSTMIHTQQEAAAAAGRILRDRPGANLRPTEPSDPRIIENSLMIYRDMGRQAEVRAEFYGDPPVQVGDRVLVMGTECVVVTTDTTHHSEDPYPRIQARLAPTE